MKMGAIIGKIFLGILIAIVVLIIAAIIAFKWIDATNKTVHKSKEVKLMIDNPAHRALIIYQPARSSITKKVAETLGRTLNDMGYEVTMNYPSPELKYDVSKFDVILLGTPVYMGQVSTVLEAYIQSIADFSGKKVMLFSTGGAPDTTNEANKLAVQVKGAKAFEKVKVMGENTDEAVALLRKLAGE